MAKIEFCIKTSALRSLLLEGRSAAVRLEVAGLLREGFATKPFLRLAAELLDPPRRGKGAPSRPPQRWLEIGEAFEELRDSGVSHQEAVVALAGQFHRGERTIERAVRDFRAARDAAK